MSKDVSCQTSDCEVIPIEKKNEKNEKEKNRSTSVEKRRKFYSDHRRATDSLAMLSPNRARGNRSTVDIFLNCFSMKYFLPVCIIFSLQDLHDVKSHRHFLQTIRHDRRKEIKNHLVQFTLTFIARDRMWIRQIAATHQHRQTLLMILQI